MLGDCALRQVEVRGEVYDPVLTECEVPEDREPRWVAEAVEQARRRCQPNCFEFQGSSSRRGCLSHRHTAMIATSGGRPLIGM